MVAEVEEMRQSKDGFSDIFFPRNHSRGTDKNQRALKTALKMDKRPKDFQLYPGWKPMRFVSFTSDKLLIVKTILMQSKYARFQVKNHRRATTTLSEGKLSLCGGNWSQAI